jgi:16S rRNA (uracil1498-N3)-methyltransferase
VEHLESDRELPIHVSLAQGIPKGDKMDWVIQKGTELGANEFVPFTSSRTIVQLDAKKETKRLERWGKIAKESAEQAHRSIVPQFTSVKSWKQLMAYNNQFDLVLLGYENESSRTIHQALEDLPEDAKRILLIIGPEGGFSSSEVDDAMEAGIQVVMLGKRILRTETAGLYGLSSISYYFEMVRGR